MSNNLLHPDTSNLPYYVATYKGRSVAIKRDSDHQSTIKLVQKSIPKLRKAEAHDIFLSTALESYGGALVQISEEIWPDIVSHVKTVEIALEGEDETDPDWASTTNSKIKWTPRSHDTADTSTDLASRHIPDCMRSLGTLPGYPDSFSISVRTQSRKLLEVDGLRSNSSVGHIKSLIEAKYIVPAALQRLELFGERLKDANTLEQSGVTEWTVLDLALYARQSIIYLCQDPTIRTSEPITHKDVVVHLSLDRGWELSALRPSRKQIISEYAQTASWTLDVASSGRLFEHGSKAELNHIFWDGISNSVQSSTSISALPQRQSTEPPPPYDRSNSILHLDPSNSSAVRFENIFSYIEKVFSCIGITYISWYGLVYQLKQKAYDYLALRFVSQDEYESISTLSVSPSTEHICRLLVLYKGLSAQAADIWYSSSYLSGVADVWKDLIKVKSTNNWSSQPGIKMIEVAWMEVF